MHRYVWEKEKGPISKGLHVHHIDENKDNNTIQNLCLITASDHMKLHADKYIEKNRNKFNDHLDNIRPLASAWHKSDLGRKAKSERMIKAIQIRPKIARKCEYCGNETVQIGFKEKRFCGKGCNASFRRGSIFQGHKS